MLETLGRGIGSREPDRPKVTTPDPHLLTCIIISNNQTARARDRELTHVKEEAQGAVAIEREAVSPIHTSHTLLIYPNATYRMAKLHVMISQAASLCKPFTPLQL